jgi:hypothetical protein
LSIDKPPLIYNVNNVHSQKLSGDEYW